MSELALIFYKAVKHNSHCLLCGTTQNLQFHHVEPADKVSEIHRIAKSNNLAATIKELNKTVPLCDFDHQRVHNGQQHGWLRGQFNNGRPSHAAQAMHHMPYLNWLAERKPHVFLELYREHIQDEGAALASIVGAPQPKLLRLVK